MEILFVLPRIDSISKQAHDQNSTVPISTVTEDITGDKTTVPTDSSSAKENESKGKKEGTEVTRKD